MAGKGGGFADLLDGTFSLISRTWVASLVFGGVLFIPPSALFGWAYGRFLDVLRDMAGVGAGEYGTLMARMGVAYAGIALAVLVQGVVFLFVRACVTEIAARARSGGSVSPWSAAAHVLSRRYGPLLLQRLIQTVIIALTTTAAVLVAGLAAGLAAALGVTVLAVILGVLLGLAGLGVAVWISVRYTVTLESMVVDGTGVEPSFDQSMALVRGRWWKVFGYTLLFGLMVSFASSLVATPIMFFSTIRQFIHNLEAVLRDTSGQLDLNAAFLRLLSGMGRRLGILQYVQSVASGFVTPVFMTLLFFQLKEPPALNAPADLKEPLVVKEPPVGAGTPP